MGRPILTTYHNQQIPSGHSPSGIPIPRSYIDAQMLYEKLTLSIFAKCAALEIRFKQTVFRQDADAEQDRGRIEFSVLADQYERDLIVEALTVVIQHSAMRDYCNVPLHLPVSDYALQMIAITEGHEFDTVPYVKNRKDENTYIPNILGIYMQARIAVMASVGAFTKMDDANLHILKQHMMAAALSLPDYFIRNGQLEPLDIVHLALIDYEIETSIADKHIWSLKDIDQFICVAGAGEAIREIKALLNDRVQKLLNRVAEKTGVVEQIKPLKEQPQPEGPAKVQVAFMKAHQQGH